MIQQKIVAYSTKSKVVWSSVISLHRHTSYPAFRRPYSSFMDSGRARSSPPLRFRKKTKLMSSFNRDERTYSERGPIYEDSINDDVLTSRKGNASPRPASPPIAQRSGNGGRLKSALRRERDAGPAGRERQVLRDVREDGMLFLIKQGNTVVQARPPSPPRVATGSRGQGQLVPGGNWSSFENRPIATPFLISRTYGNETRPFYRREPSTTYKRPTHKPYPYDNTTMLSNPPRYHRPLTNSRLLDAPSHLLRSMQSESQSYGFQESRSLHTSYSQATRVLYQAPNTAYPYPPSRVTMGAVTPNQLATQFSTAFITRKEDRGWENPRDRVIYEYDNDQSPALTPTASSSDTSVTTAADAKTLKNRLRELRTWEYTTLGRLVGSESDRDHATGGTRFSILSYNILAQEHLEHHMNLYKNCDPDSLKWSERFHLLLKEISDMTPDIICLQEVEESEFHQNFTPAFSRSGYRGAFKRRSGGKPDGCAIFWNGSMFSLVGKLALDLRQGHAPLLNRDNVALMLKLEPKSGRSRQRLVVATTHLLYNPKRTDIRLAQVQLLLAELDRFSFAGFGRQGESLYLPTLLCGDFNAEPHSPVATLITDGSLRYLDKHGGTAPKVFHNKNMDNFLPMTVGIDDQCRHYKLHLERVKQWKSQNRGPAELDRKTQLALINVQSEGVTGPPKSAPSKTVDEDQETPRPNTIQNSDTDNHEEAMNEIRKLGIASSFGTGTLTHDLKLRSVYEQHLDRKETRESVATTRQVNWKCVDYIFQGMQSNPADGQRVEGSLKLIRRLRLLSKNECKELGPLPNFASPSDHYPLLAEFQLK